VLHVGGGRGIYNSPWMGLMFGLIAAMWLPLFGFFLVRNAVERDRASGVGQIFATTPASRVVYVLGKWCSNMAVLALILGVLTVMAAIMQLLRGEDPVVRLWALVRPIWLMGLPALAITAALAVLWECLPFLQGTLGSAAAVCLWLGVLGIVLSGVFTDAGNLAQSTNDPFGFSWQMRAIQEERLASNPQTRLSTGMIIVQDEVETFVWQGAAWTTHRVLQRALWLLPALGLALVAALPFDRFDPARGRPPVAAGRPSHRRRARSGRVEKGSLQYTPDAAEEALLAARPESAPVQLATLADGHGHSRFGAVLLAELQLMFQGQRWWWYVVAVGLLIASAAVPSSSARGYLLAVAWLWPLALWSALGTREAQHHTQQLIFATPHPVRRQLPALWLAGFLVALACGSGVVLRLAVEGDWLSLVAWGVGATFIPTLALALGTWSGSRRLFEVVYLLWWYLGPLEGVAALDFTGNCTEGPQAAIVAVYLAGALLLMALAVAGRLRQVRS